MKLRVIDSFAAAHRLEGYQGDCGNVHGHTWRVEIEVAGGRKDRTPGMLVDFKVVKELLGEILPDHKLLNDVLPFNPTAENLARWIGSAMDEQLRESDCWIEQVTVWESERAAAIAVSGEFADASELD